MPAKETEYLQRIRGGVSSIQLCPSCKIKNYLINNDKQSIKKLINYKYFYSPLSKKL